MFEILLLIIAVTVDGFAAAVSMGGCCIRIPARSSAVLSFTGTLFLGVSVIFADGLALFLPPFLCKLISAALLISLGLYNIFKARLRRRYEADLPEESAKVIFLDELKSDTNHDKIISVKEAVVLSLALSADSLATGAASASITRGYLLPTLIITFTAGFTLIALGNRLGMRFKKTCRIDFERLCGVILILLAVINII